MNQALLERYAETSVFGETRQKHSEEIIKSVWEENEEFDLLGDIKIRRTRFQGRSIIEICPTSYKQICELREIGLINIIQNSRNRFFLSADEKQPKKRSRRF